MIRALFVFSGHWRRPCRLLCHLRGAAGQRRLLAPVTALPWPLPARWLSYARACACGPAGRRRRLGACRAGRLLRARGPVPALPLLDGQAEASPPIARAAAVHVMEDGAVRTDQVQFELSQGRRRTCL
jgi:hypothetical protein